MKQPSPSCTSSTRRVAPGEYGSLCRGSLPDEKQHPGICILSALVVRVLLLTTVFLSGTACAVPVRSARAEGQEIMSATPPLPAPISPNASRIIATVRNPRIWPPGSRQDVAPPTLSDETLADRTLYSVTVEILAADPAQAGIASMAQPGVVVEAFSLEELALDLAGKKIAAILQLAGDTRRVQWWISQVQVVP